MRFKVLTVLAFASCILLLSSAVCVAQQQQTVVQQKVTMADVDNALVKGPVFVEFETAECGYCKQQRPISHELASDYAGKVTFFFVDANENRDLARAFQITGVPQMDVIASKSDGKYAYIGKDGAVSDSIGSSRFMGLTQKDDLKKALDAAVQYKK